MIGSGLLGSSVVSQGQGSVARVQGVPWHSEGAAIDTLCRQITAHAQHDDWGVAWCAGAGVVGTDADALARETRYLASVLEAMERVGRPGRLFVASSAGGVHGLGSADYIDELTRPSPSSDYGSNKLRQEEMVGDWAASTGTPLLIGRISNLYGPGQRLSKPQGMVSQMLARCLLHTPILLSVPEETQRDFIFVDDAAGRVLKWMNASSVTGSTVKLIAAGNSITLSRLFRVVRAVTRIEPRIIRRVSATTHLQPRHLRFRSVVLPELNEVSSRPIEVGTRNTWDQMLRDYGRSGLRLS